MNQPTANKINSLLLKLVRFAKKFTIPGFQGVSLFDVSTFFWREIMKDSINMRAGAISYNVFIALFPFTIFLFTLVPYIPMEDLHGKLIFFVSGFLPEFTVKSIESTINDLIEIPRKGLASIGFLMALYFGSNGISSMINAFDKDNPNFKNENYFVKSAKAIGLTILLTFLLLSTVALMVGGSLVVNNIIEFLELKSRIAISILKIFEFLMFFFLVFNSIAILYYLAPSLKEKWNYFSPGAFFTSILIIISTYGFTFFINNYNSYNRIYGSIGVIMAVMLLIYIISILIIIGFELNNSIASNKHMQKQIPTLEK